MSVRIRLLFLSVLLPTLLSLGACVAQDPSDPLVAGEDEPALSTISAAAISVIDYPDSTYPVPVQRYAETWYPTTSQLSWPTNATRLQIIIRRGYAATLYTPATFFVFIVSDSTLLRRILLVRNSDAASFMAHLNTVLTTAETPNSERSHSIAGGLYVGPHPVGPPGDPINTTYINRILSSASVIDDYAQRAITETF